ncbi:glycosyltransferase family 4 protein [Sphingobium yanoikuyae]|uniref:glycosyltransferase family 4 protein n=1 Tax=Sphingobium yanoikuyae TaxID=13690 RepID=UPI0009C0BA77|nr:glycosyltransferase family 1 protein [Sphingobium yanoikuyae]
MSILKGIKLAMDGRILGRPGSGIATYAAQLREAQLSLQPDASLIVDDDCAMHFRPDGIIAMSKRSWTARFCNGQPALRQSNNGRNGLYAPDVYRLAAARFRRHFRMTCLRPTVAETSGRRHLVHWSLPLPVRVDGWVNIYTVHDVIPITHPELTPMDAERHGKLLDIVMRQADHIVTVSDHARHEIIRVTGYPADRVTNCGVAIRPAEGGAPLPLDLRQKGYFLYVGSGEKRKNLDRIVKAYSVSGLDVPLVLVGDHHQYIDRNPNIFCLPHQPAVVINSLIRHALALVFPSLVEGFGLPVAEAMVAGTAVLTADQGALAEVAGQAALLVDPEDVDAIANGLRRLFFDEALRQHYEQAGPLQVSKFSQASFAKRIETLYAAFVC